MLQHRKMQAQTVLELGAGDINQLLGFCGTRGDIHQKIFRRKGQSEKINDDEILAMDSEVRTLAAYLTSCAWSRITSHDDLRDLVFDLYQHTCLVWGR